MLGPHRGGTLKGRTSLETRASLDSSQDENAPPAMVLPSSTELFYFYGQNLEQCGNFGQTGTGKALFDLWGVHKKWLKVYAEEVLLASMKKCVLVLSFEFALILMTLSLGLSFSIKRESRWTIGLRRIT